MAQWSTTQIPRQGTQSTDIRGGKTFKSFGNVAILASIGPQGDLSKLLIKNGQNSSVKMFEIVRIPRLKNV